MPKPKTKIKVRYWSFAYHFVKSQSPVHALRESSDLPPQIKQADVARIARTILRRDEVQRLIEEIKMDMKEHSRMTIEQHLDKLAEIRDLSIKRGQMIAATKAEELRGKVAGYYVEQHQVSLADSRMNVESRLEMLKKLSPQVREIIANISRPAPLALSVGSVSK